MCSIAVSVAYAMCGIGAIVVVSVWCKNSAFVGTRAFMAPEYFTRGRYKESVDIFAVGLIIYVMVERPEDGIPRLYNRLVCDAIQVGDERIITAEFFYPLFRKSIWKVSVVTVAIRCLGTFDMHYSMAFFPFYCIVVSAWFNLVFLSEGKFLPWAERFDIEDAES